MADERGLHGSMVVVGKLPSYVCSLCLRDLAGRAEGFLPGQCVCSQVEIAALLGFSWAVLPAAPRRFYAVPVVRTAVQRGCVGRSTARIEQRPVYKEKRG